MIKFMIKLFRVLNVDQITILMISGVMLTLLRKIYIRSLQVR